MNNMLPEEILVEIEKLRVKENLLKDEKVKPLSEYEISRLPSVPDNWKWVLINDISTFITNGVHTPTGTEDTNGYGLHCLRITDIQGDADINYNELPYCLRIVAGDYDKKLRKGDIYFSFTGNNLGKRYIVKEDREDTVYAHYFVRWHPLIVNPYYVYYVAHSKVYDQFIQEHKLGSTQPNLKVTDLKRFPIPLCDMATQNKIANFLKNIDDKIACNKAINRNLSEQLKILFEDMFITKADNTWADKKLGDFLDLERGLSYKGKFLSEGEGVPMLNLGNILPNSVFRPEKLKFYTGEFKPRNVVKPGDIIVANTDLTQAREVLGSAIRVPNLGYDTAICSHHISIVRNCTISNNFILGLLNMPAYRTRVAGFATGTTVLALPNDTILNCEFKCPPKELLNIYDEISEPLYMNMEEIRLENDKLAEIRDSLLPKLMSGELDVSELEYE